MVSRGLRGDATSGVDDATARSEAMRDERSASSSLRSCKQFGQSYINLVS